MTQRLLLCFTSSYGPLEKARSTPVPVLHEDPDRLVYTCFGFKSHCASLNLEVHRCALLRWIFCRYNVCMYILEEEARLRLLKSSDFFFEVCAGSNSTILFCGKCGTVNRLVSNSRAFQGQTWPESCWPSIRGKGFLQWEVSRSGTFVRLLDTHQIIKFQAGENGSEHFRWRHRPHRWCTGTYQAASGASSHAFRRVYGTFIRMQEAFVVFEDDSIAETNRS